jgi:hypothetical protein
VRHQRVVLVRLERGGREEFALGIAVEHVD